jgi:hypothetical protein
MINTQWALPENYEEPQGYDFEKVRKEYTEAIGYYYSGASVVQIAFLGEVVIKRSAYRFRLRQILPSAFDGYRCNDKTGELSLICEPRKDDHLYGPWIEFEETYNSVCPVDASTSVQVVLCNNYGKFLYIQTLENADVFCWHKTGSSKITAYRVRKEQNVFFPKKTKSFTIDRVDDIKSIHGESGRPTVVTFHDGTSFEMPIEEPTNITDVEPDVFEVYFALDCGFLTTTTTLNSWCEIPQDKNVKSFRIEAKRADPFALNRKSYPELAKENEYLKKQVEALEKQAAEIAARLAELKVTE